MVPFWYYVIWDMKGAHRIRQNKPLCITFHIIENEKKEMLSLVSSCVTAVMYCYLAVWIPKLLDHTVTCILMIIFKPNFASKFRGERPHWLVFHFVGALSSLLSAILDAQLTSQAGRRLHQALSLVGSTLSSSLRPITKLLTEKVMYFNIFKLEPACSEPLERKWLSEARCLIHSSGCRSGSAKGPASKWRRRRHLPRPSTARA